MITVIDTNIVVSRYFSPSGPPARIMDCWEQRLIDVLLSEPILDEYRRVLRYDHVRDRHRLDDRGIEELIGNLRRAGVLVRPRISLSVIPEDPADNKFLECAVEGGADVVVSGDKHLLRLGQFRGIEILSPVAFLALLTGMGGSERS